MDNQHDIDVAKAVPEIDVPAPAPADVTTVPDPAVPEVDPQAPAQAQAQPQPAPYVRQRPAHRNVGTVSDYDESGEAAPAQTAHDSGYTNRGSLVSGGAYRRSRSDAKKLRRDLHYGQYLEIPKGRRDIFVKRERTTRIKTALALIVVIAVLAVVVHFMWGYMQANWGATG